MAGSSIQGNIIAGTTHPMNKNSTVMCCHLVFRESIRQLVNLAWNNVRTHEWSSKGIFIPRCILNEGKLRFICKGKLKYLFKTGSSI